MKYKTKFARIVNVAQLVECIVEADSLEQAEAKFHEGDFMRFLVVKQEIKEVTPVGQPEFQEIR